MERSAAKARRLARMREHRLPVAIGICASTGGPRALELLLAELPATYPIPVLVIQHMGEAAHSRRLARWLDAAVSAPVRVPVDGERLAPGVWLAPAGMHMQLGRWRRLELLPRGASDWHCPSGNVLLSSLADVLGADAVAVVLTGIGSDGAEGLLRVGACGGLTIAQDELSSTVFGMPKAAIEHGADLVLDPVSIGVELAALAVAGRRKMVTLPHPAEGGRAVAAFR